MKQPIKAKTRQIKARNYRGKKWFSLNSLADFIAEYNKDGKYDKSAWNFWRWLDRKSG